MKLIIEYYFNIFKIWFRYQR